MRYNYIITTEDNLSKGRQKRNKSANREINDSTQEFGKIRRKETKPSRPEEMIKVKDKINE